MSYRLQTICRAIVLLIQVTAMQHDLFKSGHDLTLTWGWDKKWCVLVILYIIRCVPTRSRRCRMIYSIFFRLQVIGRKQWPIFLTIMLWPLKAKLLTWGHTGRYNKKKRKWATVCFFRAALAFSSFGLQTRASGKIPKLNKARKIWPLLTFGDLILKLTLIMTEIVS